MAERLSSEIVALKERLLAHEQRIAWLSKSIESLVSKVAELESLRELKPRFEELLSALVTCKDAILVLLQENRRLLEEKKRREQEIAELSKQRDCLKEEIEGLKLIKKRVAEEGKICSYRTSDRKEVIYIPTIVKKYACQDGKVVEEYEYPFVY